jgi:hypothetical protein
MSTRTPRKSHTLTAAAPILAAVLTGGLLTAHPAWSVEPRVGPVKYFGTVTCKQAFPHSKFVPTRVRLDSGVDDVTVRTIQRVNRRARYGPVELDVPLHRKFHLTVQVTCKEHRKATKQFTRVFSQKNLVMNQVIRLDIR